ncbi:MAG: MerR family transcriptional regulator [Janthinobacterium lividum]
MPPTVQHSITELAREFDVTPRTIRFYEDQGLLAPSREGAGGLRRVFSPRDRTRLRLTLRGKRLGFTLSQIRELLDLYDSPTDTVAQLEAFIAALRTHRQSLESQLDDLQTTLDELTQYEKQCQALLASGVSAGAAKPDKAAPTEAAEPAAPAAQHRPPSGASLHPTLEKADTTHD